MLYVLVVLKLTLLRLLTRLALLRLLRLIRDPRSARSSRYWLDLLAIFCMERFHSRRKSLKRSDSAIQLWLDRSALPRTMLRDKTDIHNEKGKKRKVESGKLFNAAGWPPLYNTIPCTDYDAPNLLQRRSKPPKDSLSDELGACPTLGWGLYTVNTASTLPNAGRLSFTAPYSPDALSGPKDQSSVTLLSS